MLNESDLQMKIIITGSKGQLGQELVELLSKKNEVYAYDLEIDITDFSKIISFFPSKNPDIILHCAAYTDVDGCEINPEQAYQINSEGTKNVATAAKKSNASMVYISTDFVFDGKKEEPYLESDEPNPLSVYGKSKLDGEKHVKNLLNKYWITRTSWLFGKGKNFVQTILKLAKERDELSIVDDQVGSPTYAKDLAKKIVELTQAPTYGLYHVSNQGSCSWFEFAKDILESAGIKGIKVKPITSKELKRPAERPKYSVMKNSMLERNGFKPMRNYKEALQEYLNAL